jgi:hypothetical protein
MSSWDSAVIIAINYGLEDQGMRVWLLVVSWISSSPQHTENLWGPPNLLFIVYWGSPPTPQVRRPWCEADHSTPTTAKVKKI